MATHHSVPHTSKPAKRKGGNPSPVGLSDKIPVNGPVYLLRGAVYLSDRETFSISPDHQRSLHNDKSITGQTHLSSSEQLGSNETKTKANKGAVSFTNPPSSSLPLISTYAGGRASPSTAAAAGKIDSLRKDLQTHTGTEVTPKLLPHQRTPLDKVMQSAELYLESELRLLSSAPERDPTAFKAAVAAVYGTAVRMLLPYVAAKVSHLVDRCLREYEIAIGAAAQQASQPVRSAEERAKMENELRSMYLLAAEDRAKELDRRQAELDSSANGTAHRVLQLENQLATARQEILKLKATQSDETDRFSNMAQSVLESRLAAQKAEIALQEMKERYDRVKVTEMVYMDLLQDHQDMNLLLREKRIPFKSRIHFSVDDLLGEPSAAVLARHATTIKAQQQSDMMSSVSKK